MIIRIEARPRGFTQIDNRTLRDKRLTLKSKGALAWLLSFPDDWEGSAEALIDSGPDGRDAVRAALKELESFGYLRRQRVRGEDGRWRVVMFVFERPSVVGLSDATVTDNPSWSEGHTVPAVDNPEPAGDEGEIDLDLLEDPIASSQVSTRTDSPASENPSLSTNTKYSILKTEVLSDNGQPAFDLFWAYYPRKTGKGAARKSFAKRVDTGADPTHLCESAHAYAQWTVAALGCGELESMRFVPHPATWLNQERDQDTLTMPGKAPAAASKSVRAMAEYDRRFGDGAGQGSGDRRNGHGRVGLGDGAGYRQGLGGGGLSAPG